MDQLFRVRVDAAAALQHPAHGGVLRRAGDQAAGPRQETLGQVQGLGGGADAAPGHHEVHRQEVSRCRSAVSGAITGYWVCFHEDGPHFCKSLNLHNN